MNKIHLKNFSYSIILLMSIIGINTFLSFDKPINPESFTTLNSHFVKITSLGNYRFLSSLTWTKTLLDADTEHVKKGKRAWLYHRFKLISDLDPTFYENYLQGGIYLSIIKDDTKGAEEIFLKGLTFYPNDYKLTYYTAFNYHFELNDYVNSLKYYQKLEKFEEAKKIRILPALIEQAKKKISPDYIKLLTLQKEYRDSKDEKVKEAILKKIERIKKGKKCLNR